jgi:hypothetical protein|tara:strand:- start:1335 stop:1946 length:612 start_codon:yes stop_codon:yes gene_type:complete
MLLTDTNLLENVQILSESKADGTMRITGRFQLAEAPNNNKRVYSKELLEREAERLVEAYTARRLMGELDHPTHDHVSLQNVSHLITRLKMKGNEMIGEAELLNTPAGQVAQALLKGGVQLGISSRGMGTLTEGSDGYKYVNEDFKLLTFDLVADPSTKGAFPGLVKESVDSEFIQKTINETMGRARSEQIFITLLRDKLKRRG